MGVKLGQKWAVKDGNLLASNQVGSRFFNKEFDFSRTTSGTYIDRDGVLQTAELYNKIEYSQDFESGSYGRTNLNVESSSVVSPDGFENAYKLIPTAVNGVHLLTNATINNAVYSVFAKQGGYKRFRLNTGSSGDGYASFDLDLGQVVQSGGTYYIDSGIEDYGNGWYRCYLAIGATSGTTTTLAMEDNSGSVAFTADGTSGIYVYGMQVVEGTEPLDYQYTNGLQGLPRISYENGVGHLLLEPQRSNLITYSEDFSQWSASNATTTSNSAISPSGLLNADKVIASSANTTHAIFVIPSVSSLTTYTFSLYAKADEYERLYIRQGTGTSPSSAVYELTGVGSVLETYGNPQVTSISNVGNGWYRITLTNTTSSSSPNFAPNIMGIPNSGYTASEDSVIFLGDGTSGVYIWGAQLEEGSYATSYIKSDSGTTTTRNADVCNNSGSAQDFNSEEGVLYAEIARFEGDTTATTLSINDGSNSNMVTFYYFSTNEVYFDILSSSPNVSASTTIDDTSNLNKIALKYKSGDIALWVNGQELITRTSAISLSGLNELSFSYGNNISPFYGKVKNLQVFTEALSDDELISLTT